MMTRALSAATLTVLAVLSGCREYDLDARETGDLGYGGPYSIDTVERECVAGTPDVWSFHARTQGWAHAMTLEVLEPATPGAAESHPLTNVDYDRAGAWDEWDATLLTATHTDAVQAGETTAWGCDDAAGLAWHLVMYAPDAPETPIDCVVWGEAASLAMAGPAGLVCRCVEVDESC